MNQIEDQPNSYLHFPFWSMHPSVRGIFNDGIGGYDVAVVRRSYEVQEEVQRLLWISISIIYAVDIFGCIRLTAWIRFYPTSDLAE